MADTVIMLTQGERDRFAGWLEQEASTDDLLATQAEKLGAIGAVLAKMKRSHAAAYLMVARTLRAIESISM